jgi:murein DD-endopeptidase MepM/ murein hydrolase activator NlpD
MAGIVLLLLPACGKNRDSQPVLLSSAPPVMSASFSVPEIISPAAVEVLRSNALPPRPEYTATIQAKLGKGDNLFDILIKNDIDSREIHELVTAARCVHNLSRMRQDQTFCLDFDTRDGRILRFVTDIDQEHRLVVERNGQGLESRKETYEFEIKHEVVSGTIHNSLFLAATDAGLPPILILELAEIFAWDIDFNVDIRQGDSFDVLYETKYLNGEVSHRGGVLAARVVSQNKPFWAFYFQDSTGKSDYYDQAGRSLRKAFLKSPLTYRRISSGFSYRRFHPILKIYRPHLGVDYAAPTGTPVRTLGDGRIKYAGWKGGFGRYIEVRHNDIYTTTYGHLHRYAKGISKGKYVEQGQVIGYVGSSGLSTGPHLDFRLLKNGQFINPLKVNFPDADPVRAEEMEAFKKITESFIEEMERTRQPEKITESSHAEDSHAHLIES